MCMQLNRNQNGIGVHNLQGKATKATESKKYRQTAQKMCATFVKFIITLLLFSS